MRNVNLPYSILIPFGNKRDISPYKPQISTDGLKLWLRPGFVNSGNDWIESTGNTGNATWHSSVTWVRDFKGQIAANCPGDSNGYLTTTGNVGISGDAEFTLCAWLSLNATADAGMMGWGNTGVALNAAGFYISSSKPTLAFAGGNSAVPPTTLSNNVYTFVCAVKTAGNISANTKFYYDGDYLGANTGSTSTPNITNGTFSVGQWANYTGDHKNCIVSQVMLYNRALSAGEVYNLHKWSKGN